MAADTDIAFRLSAAEDRKVVIAYLMSLGRNEVGLGSNRPDLGEPV